MSEPLLLMGAVAFVSAPAAVTCAYLAKKAGLELVTLKESPIGDALCKAFDLDGDVPPDMAHLMSELDKLD